MQHVSGIGGVFIRAKDPATLEAWYAEMLGLESDPFWMQPGGPTVFAGFAQDTEYFGRPEQAFMLNFRVDDLDAMIAQLKAKGVAVITKAEWNSDVGRFARVHDPEDNPIELWEPAGD